MAESTLSLGYADFRAEIGRYFSFTRDPTGWSAVDAAEVNAALHRGVRMFYAPPVLPGERAGHVWTFLRPVTTLSTVAAQGDYDLPDNFGGIDGRITYASGTFGVQPITLTGEGQIRQYRQSSVLTAGRPTHGAVRPKSTGSGGSVGSRFELLLWPTPDAVHVLTYRYFALQNALTAGNPYPLGGAIHAETVLQACLAAAESTFPGKKDRHHYGLFIERLKASVAHDRAMMAPETLGYNGDGTGPTTFGRRDRSSPVTYQPD